MVCFKLALPGYSDAFVGGTLQRMHELAGPGGMGLEWVSKRRTKLTPCLFEMTGDVIRMVAPISFIAPALLDFGEVAYEASDLNWQVLVEFPRKDADTYVNITMKDKCKQIMQERLAEVFTLGWRTARGQVS